MQSRSNSTADALFEIADEQQGYFTAKQAADAGYLLGSQAHHVKAGNWVRVHRGIYRPARFPQSADEQLVIYSLWSRNRAGKPEGVYSLGHQPFETADHRSTRVPQERYGAKSTRAALRWSRRE